MTHEDLPNLLLPVLQPDGELVLELRDRLPADPDRGLVLCYDFTMKHRVTGAAMGRVSLRVGDTEHIRMYAGHIGYAVDRAYRGNRYAERSCRLLLPLARTHGMKELWITCDPENAASRRTIERLGAELVDIVPVPPGNPLYLRGELWKCRFRLLL